MRLIKQLASTAIAVAMLASCQKETKFSTSNDDLVQKPAPADNDDLTSRNNGKKGYVYTLSNQTGGNMVLVYKRNNDGTLNYMASYATGGNGSGGGLGNQGAVIIGGDDDNEVLLAVNAGSNTVSSFKIHGNGSLMLKSTVSSGGMRPVSIAVYDDLVYVLNAGGSGNISGFELGENARLTPLTNSTKPLSSSAAGAAQVSFVRNGKVLVVTEKATNKIITYTVNESGRPDVMHSITSASPTPFGFASGHFGNIYVSEAVGGAPNASNVSSYHIGGNGVITLADGPNATNQSAACWVVLTDNGKYIYTTNTASNTISSFNVMQASGNLNLLQSVAATSGAGPIDATLSDNSNYLYVLNGAGQSISAYAVAANGSLTGIQTVSGLPAGTNGLAAF